MFWKNASENWEKFGSDDPYYGVLSHDRYHKEAMDGDTRQAFFDSGSEYIDDVVNKIIKHVSPEFSPSNSLDFGCGVGRLLIPISKISKQATGVDVSASMLKETQVNLKEFSINNVELIESENCSCLKSSSFDFVHSFIVFQHIPIEHGMLILDNIMGSLKLGGVGVLHFTFWNPGLHGLKGWIKRFMPFLKFIKRAFNEEFFNPEMQMNEYDLNEIHKLLSTYGVSAVYSELSNHDGIRGGIFYFKTDVDNDSV